MSGWIKMRSCLLQSPKLIALSRRLNDDAEFRKWLTSETNDVRVTLSDGALQRVTLGALLCVWSAAREHGVFASNDLHLKCIGVRDLDQIGGVPGLGLAMLDVGWAKESEGSNRCVILPNFKEHNVPMSAADRQKKYRQRSSNCALRRVTKRDVTRRNDRVTPSDAKVTPKRREENINPPQPPDGGESDEHQSKPTPPKPVDRFPEFWSAYPRKVGKLAAVKAWSKIDPDDTLATLILAAVARQKKWEDWRRENGRFIPHPSTWLNGRRWEDEEPKLTQSPPKTFFVAPAQSQERHDGIATIGDLFSGSDSPESKGSGQ